MDRCAYPLLAWLGAIRFNRPPHCPLLPSKEGSPIGKINNVETRMLSGILLAWAIFTVFSFVFVVYDLIKNTPEAGVMKVG